MFQLLQLIRKTSAKHFVICFFNFACVFFIPLQAYSAAIGLPESNARFGFGANISHNVFEGRDGHTERLTSSQPYSLYYSDWIYKKGLKQLAELHVSNYAFSANGDHAGLVLRQIGVRYSVQKDTRIGALKPWLGAGIGVSYSQLNKQHTVDSDGFLLERSDDSKAPSLSLLLNVMQMWRINSELDVAAKLEYSLPIAQSLSGVSASLLIFFLP